MNVWRLPSTKLESGSFLSFREDRGMLEKAVKNSKGFYQFSETVMGMRPLAVIGTRDELGNFLQTAAGGIENTIAGFPDIYMGILPWSPKERYRMITPLGDALKKTLCRAPAYGLNGAIASCLHTAANIVSNVGCNLSTFAGHAKIVRALKIPGASLPPGLLCLTFSYVPESGMRKIGTRQIWFSTPNFGPPPTPQRDNSLVYRGFLGL